jgi:SAM-dependent methyltransferase
MAFMQIKSDNPDFSYILKKNPTSGLVARKLRRGVLFGYYSEASTYNVFFKDAFNEISYPEHKDQKFEYTNATRYNSAQFVLNTFSELLRDIHKKQSDQDVDGHNNLIMCNLVHLSSQRTISSFAHHFDDVSVDTEPMGLKQYRVTFKTNKSLYYLANVVALFATFTVVQNNKEYLFLDDSTIEKYTSSLEVIDAPYFIRYMFKTYLFRGQNMFKKYKSRLETSAKYPITMEFGDTHMMRIEAIQKHMDTSHHVVDLGCGEGRYVFKLASNLKDTVYHAIDVDEECRDKVARGCLRKQIENVEVFESLDAYLATPQKEGSYDFLCTEVIEHMEIEKATELVRQCLEHPKAKTVIITTPNRDFNRHYFDGEGELRHSDHIFEFTKEEFINWLHSIWSHLEYSLETFSIGDTVDGVETTLGAVFRRRE